MCIIVMIETLSAIEVIPSYAYLNPLILHKIRLYNNTLNYNRLQNYSIL